MQRNELYTDWGNLDLAFLVARYGVKLPSKLKAEADDAEGRLKEIAGAFPPPLEATERKLSSLFTQLGAAPTRSKREELQGQAAQLRGEIQDYRRINDALRAAVDAEHLKFQAAAAYLARELVAPMRKESVQMQKQFDAEVKAWPVTGLEHPVAGYLRTGADTLEGCAAMFDRAPQHVREFVIQSELVKELAT